MGERKGNFTWKVHPFPAPVPGEGFHHRLAVGCRLSVHWETKALLSQGRILQQQGPGCCSQHLLGDRMAQEAVRGQGAQAPNPIPGKRLVGGNGFHVRKLELETVA